jgi:hypothetical protein
MVDVTGPDDDAPRFVPGGDVHDDVARLARRVTPPAVEEFEQLLAWKAFGQAVLLLCDSPFAEWSITDVPGLTQAGTQVRTLADTHGIRR